MLLSFQLKTNWIWWSLLINIEKIVFAKIDSSITGNRAWVDLVQLKKQYLK